MSVILNDVHSRLNPTRVSQVITPNSIAECRAALFADPALPVSIAGGRHAMGGQQFGQDCLNIDTRSLCQVISFDAVHGLVRAEAGIQWPMLIQAIRDRNSSVQPQWGIRQKQTGASDVTLGGSLSANVHGRGLEMQPFISDVESFRLLDHRGELLHCSRHENNELFRLVIGGYGLFGVIADVTLRLARRTRVQRCVSIETADQILGKFESAIESGSCYGDFQFAIDHESADFLYRGIFSHYRRVATEVEIPDNQIYFTPEKWLGLLRLARTRRTEAYHRYIDFYMSTNGQFYDSDTHQLSTYVPRYHDTLTDLPLESQGTEVISELYVPRERLGLFLVQAASVLRSHHAPLTYGTVRLIRRDEESFLRWAKEDYACVIFNLLTPETAAGCQRTATTFRALFDVALALGGSFYLTYHTYATREQLLAAYPELPEFLNHKRRFDPNERFQSTWYHRIRRLIAGELALKWLESNGVSASLPHGAQWLREEWESRGCWHSNRYAICRRVDRFRSN